MTAWTDVIGWALVHFVWQGTGIAAVAAVGLWLLRHAAPRVRYAAACSALFAALLAPAATAVVLMGPGTFLSAPGRVANAAPVSIAGVRYRAGDPSTVPAGAPRRGGLLSPDAGRPAGTVLPWLVSVWAAGVFLLTVRLLIGWWRIRRLHLDALSRPPSEWLAAAIRIGERLRLRHAVHVVDSLHVDVPTVIGWLRPVVLLPAAALTNLSPGQVQAILAHELAHIRRHDFIVNLLQAVAETLLFYHPAVWWLSARIRAEREHCCDDIAVDVCGDPVGYAEALTMLATWAHRHVRDGSPALALAATGGSLLARVRRLMRMPANVERRRPRAPIVIAAAVVVMAVVGSRLLLVAQVPDTVPEGRSDRRIGPGDVNRILALDLRRIGPRDVNRVLGFDLFPGPARYATDDPSGARAWDVTVAFPGGEMSFIGFTARGLVRYGYGLDGDQPVDGPEWLDRSTLSVRGETSAADPTDQDFRDAIRLALEGQYGVSIRQETRLVPVYALQIAAPGRLGPNLRPSVAECVESGRDRLATIGPNLRARGQMMPFCGMEDRITGARGYRVTLAQFARSLRGFQMEQGKVELAREVVDQTGLTGVYDLQLQLGFLPAAAIAAAHFQAARLLWPLGVRTFPQAIEEQLGLRLVPVDQPRDVMVIVTAQQLHARADQLEPALDVLSSAN